MIYSDTSAYTVHDLIGTGRFSNVYRATNKCNNEKVVIKVLSNKETERKFDRYLYLKELNILKTLRTSPLRDRYVGLKDTVRLNTGLDCFVMEKLGVTLHALLHNFGKLSMTMCRSIVRQIAQGLAGLKYMGIVHADLKPDNIMFGSGTENNHMVKIIDFGWAFLIKDAEVMYRKKFQAVPYRAPEVCFRARLGHGLDVWALGCIMAEIATGQKLFDVSEEKHLVKMMIRALSVPTFLVADSENIDLETNLSDGWVQFKNLDKDTSDPQKNSDNMQFTELVYKMLTVLPDKRITAVGALAHPFLTMRHFIEYPKSDMTKTNVVIMEKCEVNI